MWCVVMMQCYVEHSHIFSRLNLFKYLLKSLQSTNIDNSGQSSTKVINEFSMIDLINLKWPNIVIMKLNVMYYCIAHYLS